MCEKVATGNNTPTKEESSFRIMSVLNSPFCVTFLGGFIIAIVTIVIQIRIQSYQKKTDIEKETRDRQYAMIAHFSEGIGKYLQLSLGMLKREFWLGQNQNNPQNDTISYPDKRNFIETRNYYEKQREIFNKLVNPDALCGQARLLFRRNETVKAIDTLDSLLDNYVKTRDSDTLYSLFDQANQKYQEIIRLMGKEVLNE